MVLSCWHRPADAEGSGTVSKPVGTPEPAGGVVVDKVAVVQDEVMGC